MIQAGKFGADRPKHQGRPRWKLVDEKLGKEVDISSSFCIPIRSRAVRKTLDADKEEWDIIDDGTNPCEPKVGKARRWSMTDSDSEYTMSTDSSRKPARKSSATKPSAERRIRVSVGAGSIPPLVASYPGEKKSFYVRLSGHRLYDPSFEYPIRLKVGRPRGSTGKYTFKAKPKPPPQASIARVEASVSQPLQKRGRPTVSRNMPKQMEPEVQVPLLSGKKRKDPPPLDASDEVPKKRGPGRPKKSTQTTLFPFIRPSPIRPKRVANGEDASSTGQTIRTRRSLYDGDTAPPSASKNSSNAVIKRGPGRPPKRSKSVPPSLDRTEPAGDHGRRGRPPKRPESPDSSDSRQENRANTPKRRGRPPKRSKSVPPLSESRENVELPKRRGRPPKKATPIVSQDERPRRVAAPAFLGESPMSPYQAGTNPRRGRKRPMIEEESSVDDSFSLPTPVEQRTTRSKTSPSPSRSTRYSSRVGSGTQKSISPYLEIVPRKRRKVNSAGSRRTVLQN